MRKIRILEMTLINFIGIYAAKGVYEYTVSFAHITEPIIQIFGPNRCGKSVITHQLHPYSSLNLNGDERNELPLVIPGLIGKKIIVYEIDDEVYRITHTYAPTKNSHTVSSSLIHNGEEMNPSGGVNLFINTINQIMGINKYIYQFLINGTQLTSFGVMSDTQRKQALNKAMGIDIYDKIHKMSTDDYRYTNKLITSLNNTKEFLLANYGSYENLYNMLQDKQIRYNELTNVINQIKSRLDSLSGKISVIRQQNVSQELIDVNNQIMQYDDISNRIGCFDENKYDKLVSEQISLNNTLSELRNKKLLIMKDMDVLYEKKTNIENDKMINQRTINDYNNMMRMAEDLTHKIDDIKVEFNINSSSNYLCSMLQLAQAVNSIGKEIVTSLNSKHMKLLVDMITKGIDISAFLIKEGNDLMDSDKERATISRLRNIINGASGDHIKDCPYESKCIYKNTYEMIDTYFKTCQSSSSREFTAYDIDQFNHAYKNIQTISRLTNIEISPELSVLFDLRNILDNLCNQEYCIDTKEIQRLIEEAGNIEMRNRYIQQLAEINKSIENMKCVIDNMNSTEDSIPLQNKINEYQNDIRNIENDINSLSNDLSVNENSRLSMSQIKNINIKELRKRFDKLNKLIITLSESENEFNQLNLQYNTASNQLITLTNELKALEHANNQYLRTKADIDNNLESDTKCRIISEATSSSKGKPVIAIRDKVNEGLSITNRLLDVMYNGEMEMLNPTIDETEFTLPFRSGCNTSADIRYGSQSEATLLSMALSMSMSTVLTDYSILIADESDAYLDHSMRDKYILMIREISSVLQISQFFIVSHNILPDQYKDIVAVVDISE